MNEAAADALASGRRFMEMRGQNLSKVEAMKSRSDTNRRAFAHLESHPIVTVGGASEALGVSFATTSAAVKRLVGEGILVQTTNAARNRVSAYEGCLAELRRGTELR